MATTFEPPAGGDVIDLEPTMVLEVQSPAPGEAREAPRRPTPVARQGSVAASLVSELHGLCRGRLAAASSFLAVAFLVLLLWRAYGRDPVFSVYGLLLVLRIAVAAGFAALFVSQIPLTNGQLRASEFLLFGLMTVFVVANQYLLNQQHLSQGNLPAAVATLKNGVLNVFILMVLCGLFIPNDPWATARVVLTMALAPVVALVLLRDFSDVGPMVERLLSVEEQGTNIVILLIGAALAIYGSYVLNGLRVELHEAKRFGQYQLLRKLGEGGMGAVYLAEHQLLKRPCALKLINPESGADPVALARFEREVRSASQLSHPNSIEIYDYGHTDDGTFYYVMEYLPGMSLSDLVERYGPLPPGRVIYLLRQTCAGLSRAHALGLIHRDLKPANIYVAIRGGESDVAKVLDFGLVKITAGPDSSKLTADHHVSGTPLYMAPEQATGAPNQDHRLDIYALGAIAYFTLTGRPPFVGDTAIQVMVAHARDPVEPPSKLRADVPADLERVVLKCLEKRPDDRYPNVKALSADLAACASAPEWGPDQADLWWADVVQPVPINAGT